MVAMGVEDTIAWRRERGLTQKPQASLLYCADATGLEKLRIVCRLHALPFSEPMPNAILVASEAKVLDLVIRQWRDYLSAEESNNVRGVLFESRLPSKTELARAVINFEDLDRMVARINTRWFVKLLASDSVSVVFQPLISVATSGCVACECLVRGEQDGQEVGAESMLSNARILGLSHELDHAAWRAAFRQGHDLVKGGQSLFLNLTPSSASNAAFHIEKTKAMCREMGIEISQLVFEVTEAEKVNDFDQVKRVMEEYRNEGAKIALDDLGSGYSSILRLADLRPDYVKLDQRLVHEAHADHLRSVLLKAVTDAAHKLNIGVVAEGVETEDDLRFCVEIGVDLLQGHFLGRPEKIPPAISSDASRILEGMERPALP